jgi:tetratricopeptide (TPR) repeat protein
VKPLLPRTRVSRVTLVVYILTALLVAGFHSQIAWSWHAFGELMRGSITSDDQEYHLRVEAKRAFDAGEFDAALDAARSADSIDPNNPVTLYILAETSLRLQDRQSAIDYYEKLNRLDPAMLRPYLALAALYLAGSEPRRGEEILQSGVDYFTAAVWNMQPKPDATVPRRFSKKAVLVYQQMRNSLYEINRQLLWLRKREGKT